MRSASADCANSRTDEASELAASPLQRHTVRLRGLQRPHVRLSRTFPKDVILRPATTDGQRAMNPAGRRIYRRPSDPPRRSASALRRRARPTVKCGSGYRSFGRRSVVVASASDVAGLRMTFFVLVRTGTTAFGGSGGV